ncbi:FIST signal transduction protein [Desulfopila sp. IMCC35008]|uniref:FIST signal transduction protein n=1 Tax=Desulfopila sp. IMCC35008 TaxID=2653858 RepID=UPI0013D50F0C|nr:FIST C-terminal domain-containing protein [Desulfopila sp. IMCC35008]
MTIYFDPEGTVAGLEKCLRQASEHEHVSGLLVLCCDANLFTAEKIDSILQATTHPLAGGIFPYIIYKQQLCTQGTMVVGLQDVVTVQTISELSDPDVDYEQLLIQKMPDSSKVRTLILFVDGFSTRISPFIECLFNVFGLDFNYVGGGAGSLSLKQQPCILYNSGLIQDGAVLLFLETESGVGVCHGWQELSGPYQVTEASNNIIHTIEWQPAFDFYRSVLLEKTNSRINRDAFYATAKNYPFGIARLSGEQIVRDPYLVETDGSLVCVGEIPEGAFFSIMRADADNLIQAAADSLKLSLEALPSGKSEGLRLFVDCVSRAVVLKDQFQREIDAVYSTALPLIGICSIAEIANSGTEYLELYNRTAVMAVLARK